MYIFGSYEKLLRSSTKSQQVINSPKIIVSQSEFSKNVEKKFHWPEIKFNITLITLLKRNPTLSIIAL